MLKRIKSPEDFPKEPCFVIVEFSTYTEYTGWEDECSSGVLPRIYTTLSREEWESEIAKREEYNHLNQLYTGKIKYIAYHVDAVAQIKTEIHLNIGV